MHVSPVNVVPSGQFGLVVQATPFQEAPSGHAGCFSDTQRPSCNVVFGGHDGFSVEETHDLPSKRKPGLQVGGLLETQFFPSHANVGGHLGVSKVKHVSSAHLGASTSGKELACFFSIFSEEVFNLP